MQTLIDLLHAQGCSCVIRNGTEVRTFRQRGVADLYDLYLNEPAFLQGADIADKVVGKGAAALMRLGGIRRVYADVLSEPAAELLKAGNIPTACGQQVPHIVNRRGDGFCPLETACMEVPFERIFPVIRQFVEHLRQTAQS
ncbi:MAG: DUF1893 domain-containing protein [Bacteroidales bacterium]|nr:DUF1893 domain-containing protein [Bacteroidales bacterium]